MWLPVGVINDDDRDDGSPRFRRQTVKEEVRTGAVLKNSGIL